LWSTPRCTAGRTSASLSRTGWRLRLESTIPRSREKNGGGGICLAYGHCSGFKYYF